MPTGRMILRIYYSSDKGTVSLDFRPLGFFLLNNSSWDNDLWVKALLKIDSAVSITPLTTGGRCQWHRLPVVGGFNDTADQTIFSNIIANSSIM
jgi:hypothetical protein